MLDAAADDVSFSDGNDVRNAISGVNHGPGQGAFSHLNTPETCGLFAMIVDIVVLSVVDVCRASSGREDIVEVLRRSAPATTTTLPRKGQ